jgi:uncharacterized pyridoxamine 5'-phosphate oxidase family protein
MKDKDTLRKEALDFIKDQHTGVVATSNLAGEVFASTVYFVAKEDFTIYFATSHNTNKFKNLVLNKKTAFCIGTGPSYKSVQIRGNAEMVYDKDQQEGLNLLESLYETHPKEEWPINIINKLKEGGFVLIKITPTNIAFLDIDNRSLENNIYELHS